MKRKIFGIFSRTTLFCLEILAVLAGLCFLIGGVLLWRLSSGPVDVSFAKNYIEQALYDPVNEYSVTLQDIVVTWPDPREPLMLELGEVDLSHKGRPVASVENVRLGLSTPQLLLGQIRPVSIILISPSVQLIRTENNEVRFSLESEIPSAEPAEDDGPLMGLIETLARPPGAGDKRSPVDNLQSVEIRQARMVMEDYLLGITWYLFPLNLTFARDDMGLMITGSAELPGGRDRASRLQLDLVYARAANDFRANIHVQDFNPHVLSRKIEALDWLNRHYTIVNGNIELDFDASLKINSIGIALSSVNGQLSLDDVYDKPFTYEEMFVAASYDRAGGRVDIEQLAFKTGGVRVIVSAPVSVSPAGISAPVSIRIPELAQAQISPLWPDVLRGDGAEIWLTQRLSDGRFYDAQIDFDLAAEEKSDTWAIDVKNIVAGFRIEDMTIDYRAPLAAIRHANGSGRFENDNLSINLTEGQLGEIHVAKGRATISKIIEGGGHANIDMALSGPLRGVFEYIAKEPIGISEQDLGLDVARVQGTAKLDVNVSFPAIRDLLAEQVKVKVGGTLDEVLLPDVVKTLDLSGGPMKLTIDDGAAALEGRGRLEGRDIKFSWREFINPQGKPYVSQVKADLIADADIRAKMGIGLQDWIEGAFPVSVTYTEFGGGRSEVDVTTDLTPGQLMIGPFKHVKPPGISGSASCKIALKNGMVEEVSKLQVETPDVRMSDGRFLFDAIKGEAVLKRGHIPRFLLGDNDLRVEFEIAQSGLLKIAVDGPFLDARPFLEDDKKTSPYDGPPLIVSGSVDRMRTHPARMIDKVKFYLDMNKAGDVDQFEMDAVAGKGAIYLRVKPNEKGIMTVRLEADDAGAAMRAFDMYENVQGGKIVLYGEARNPQQRKILYGNAELTNFHVVNAPVLARLLSAISLVGIGQILGNEGIYFSRLQSRFEWHIDRRGDKYIAKDGRTSGSSLGLTFEGVVDKSTGQIDMQGTIVPVSMLNELIGAIPLIGSILTGGGGGVIAATYEIEGPIKKPEVMVNPLSVLAPGILRKLLFEGD